MRGEAILEHYVEGGRPVGREQRASTAPRFARQVESHDGGGGEACRAPDFHAGGDCFRHRVQQGDGKCDDQQPHPSRDTGWQEVDGGLQLFD